MTDPQQVSYTFSSETRPYYTFTYPTIHLIIKRPPSNENDLLMQMPVLTNRDGALSTTIEGNIEYLLTYHQIPLAEAITITHRFSQFVNALILSRRNNTTTQIKYFLTVTHYNFQTPPPMEIDTLITHLQSSIRQANNKDEDEDCSICLQTFRGREDINDIACNHKFHHHCMTQKLIL